MKRYLFLMIFWMLLAVGCSSEPLPIITETPTVQAIAEATSLPLATATVALTDVPTGQPTAIASPLPTVTATAVSPEPVVSKAAWEEGGLVVLDTAVLVDIQQETGCFNDVPSEIIYSPDEAYFLVVAFCFELDNHLFLFRADGSGKQLITERWGYLNGLNVEWAADSQSFTFERLNSCCVSIEDIPLDAPARGQVQVFVDSGEQQVVATPDLPQIPYRVVDVSSDDMLYVRSGAGVENPKVGEIPHDGVGVMITGQGVWVGQSLWVPIRYEEIVGWVNSKFLVWQN